MEFGKLQDITATNFALPPLVDAALGPAVPLTCHLGCTGWSMPQWVPRWYPRGTKTPDFAAAYGRQFNTIELNTTHYRIPDARMVANWCAAMPPDFKFAPKVHQSISHQTHLGLGADMLPLFWDALAQFGDKLGTTFIQLPPHFARKDAPKLDKWLSVWPKAFPLAVELRHESWFADADAVADWAGLLRAHQTTAVMTDVAGRRDVLHAQLTTPVAMIRFVGNGLHPTDYQRADDWCARLSAWQQMGLKEVYFFSHQPDNILSPEMAHYLAAQLATYPDIRCKPPQPIAASPDGEQMSLF